MRIVLFGSGSPLSTAALDAIATKFDVRAVVVPEPSPPASPRGLVRWVASAIARRPLVRRARAREIPVWRLPSGGQETLVARLAPLRPDVICVASFPRILRASVLDLPRRGAIGLHPSLLPRHRGGSPLFWTYAHDDAEAGVTVFWLDPRSDAGAILYQDAVPLPRGQCVTTLYAELARRGAALLVKALEAIGEGTAPRIPQDEARATRDPRPSDAGWRVEPRTWGAERLWHVLSGLGALQQELLRDPAGRPVAHGRALRWAPGPPPRPPGTIERLGAGWRVHCADGVVETAGPGAATRLRRGLRRLLP